MVRASGRSKRGRVNKRRGAGGRRGKGKQPTAEQLDFEMELMKAQREGREEEFRRENAEKKKAAKKKGLDDDMDEYFKKRDGGKGEEDAEGEAETKEASEVAEGEGEAKGAPAGEKAAADEKEDAEATK